VEDAHSALRAGVFGSILEEEPGNRVIMVPSVSHVCTNDVAPEELTTVLFCKGGSKLCGALADGNGCDAFGPYWVISLLR
jgi:hypothetical protein